MSTLYVHDAAGYRKADSHEVIRKAHALISGRFRRGTPVITRPVQVRELLKMRLGALDYEMFGALYLDARGRLIEFEDLFRGTIDTAAVHPREVVKEALSYGASLVIVYHNHPSGGLSPSPADECITHRVRDALALVDIRLYDHLIIGDGVYSMAEAGRL
jgi:DNA repair protein RadC